MSIIDFSNFEKQGNIDNDIQLNSVEDIRDKSIEISKKALRTIKIFTPDLEQLIYNNDFFRQSLLGFTKGNRHAQVQVLVNDITEAIHNGHRLIQLAQQIPSTVKIKNTPEEYQASKVSFMIVDQSLFLYRADTSSTSAVISDCKYRVGKLLEFYTPAWEQAELDPQTRQLRI